MQFKPKTTFAIWRKLVDITQANAAEVLGVSARSIERYESGEMVPRRSVRRLMYQHALFLVDDADIYAPGEWPIDPRDIPTWTAALIANNEDSPDVAIPTLRRDKSPILPDVATPTWRRVNSQALEKSRRFIRRFFR